MKNCGVSSPYGLEKYRGGVLTLMALEILEAGLLTLLKNLGGARPFENFMGSDPLKNLEGLCPYGSLKI